MNTLKEIIGVLKIIGISIAGITFIILMLKMATEPEYKEKYINFDKYFKILENEEKIKEIEYNDKN